MTEPTKTKFAGFLCSLAVSRSFGVASIATRNVDITFTVMMDSFPSRSSQVVVSIPAFAMNASSFGNVFKRSQKERTEV